MFIGLANSLRLVACLAIALSLAALPFGHRATASEITPQMADFLAMGGTFDDLCGDDTFHGGGGVCEACRIVDALHLPDAPRIAGLTSGTIEPAATAVAPKLLWATSLAIRPPARAPPSV